MIVKRKERNAWFSNFSIISYLQKSPKTLQANWLGRQNFYCTHVILNTPSSIKPGCIHHTVRVVFFSRDREVDRVAMEMDRASSGVKQDIYTLRYKYKNIIVTVLYLICMHILPNTFNTDEKKLLYRQLCAGSALSLTSLGEYEVSR